MNGWKHLLVFLYRLLFWLPMCCVVCFWLFYFRASFHLGHNPVPSLDDPKYLGLDAWYFTAAFALLLSQVAVLLLTLLLLLKLFFRKIPIWSTDLVLFGIGFFLLLLTFFSDAMTWFCD